MMMMMMMMMTMKVVVVVAPSDILLSYTCNRHNIVLTYSSRHLLSATTCGCFIQRQLLNYDYDDNDGSGGGDDDNDDDNGGGDDGGFGGDDDDDDDDEGGGVGVGSPYLAIESPKMLTLNS